MPVVITFAPTATATITPKKVYRFVLNTGHETITLQSVNTAIAVEK